jgi:plasmid stabilization system protein ParE
MPNCGSAAESGVPRRMAEFFYSPQARRDLVEIWEFIARDNLDAADRVEQEIEQAVKRLAVDPSLGHTRHDLTSKRVRFCALYFYLIIYDPESRPLEVARILSGYRDVAALLE